jgi:hypothetical protein
MILVWPLVVVTGGQPSYRAAATTPEPLGCAWAWWYLLCAGISSHSPRRRSIRLLSAAAASQRYARIARSMSQRCPVTPPGLCGLARCVALRGLPGTRTSTAALELDRAGRGKDVRLAITGTANRRATLYDCADTV